MDLTLYCRPVFDTLTKVSSSRNMCLGLQKYDSCSSICIQNQFCGGLITFDRGVLEVLSALHRMHPIGLQTIHYAGSPRSVGSRLVSRDAYFSKQTTSPFVPRSSRTTNLFSLETIKFSCFQLNLLVKAEKGDLSTFVTNGEWHLLGKKKKKKKGDDRLSCAAA